VTLPAERAARGPVEPRSGSGAPAGWPERCRDLVRRCPTALLVLAATAAVAFVVLTGLVAAGTTRQLDVAVRDWFRPHDVWGEAQVRVDVLVEGLKPSRAAPLLGVVTLVTCLARWSWRPAAYAGVLLAVTAALTLATKDLLHRPDPHQDMTAVGGSYPSGHTITVLVCLGAALLVVRQRPRWWEWLVVGLVGVTMGVSLLLQAAHWLTDVVGGMLLATTVLAVAAAVRYRAPDRAGPP